MGYKLLVALSPEELEHRRYLLNQAGFIAWLSPVIILTTIYLARRTLSARHAHLLRSRPKREGPGKSRMNSYWEGEFNDFTRKLSWRLFNTYPPTSEFGPWGVLVLTLVYTTYLLYLAISNTGNDYMHLTKALGHVAIAQLPVHYLLAIKSPRSPITLATGLTHERLNAVHRSFGRVIHLLLAAHAVLYLNFFVQLGVLDQRIKNPVVRLGLIAFWTTNFLGVFALPVVRRKMYHALFYRTHVLLSAALLVAVWFHVPYTRWYVGQAAVFWVTNGLVRRMASTAVVSASVERLEGTELVRLKIPIQSTNRIVDFVPGQHVYVNRAKGMGPKTPFTIVSVVPDTKDAGGNPQLVVELVIRNLRGPQTGWLAANITVDVVLEGPYGEASEYVPELLRGGQDAGDVLLVAGGVGATYAIPIYLALLERRKPDAGMRFVWFVRSVMDARWGIKMLSAIPSALDVDIYVTGNEEGSKSLVGKLKNGVKVHATGRRPEMKDIVDNFLGLSEGKKTPGPPLRTMRNHSRINVLGCGPPSMSTALRQEVGKHVLGYARDVRFHEEQFGLGSP